MKCSLIFFPGDRDDSEKLNIVIKQQMKEWMSKISEK